MIKRENDILIDPENKPGLFNRKATGKNIAGLKQSLLPSENDFIRFLNHCLIDHSGKQFACIHNHCHDSFSCFRQEVLHEYLSYHSLNFHPADREIWCCQVYPDILKFTAHIPKEQLHDYRVSFNHRYINKSGMASQFLHEGILSFDDEKFDTVLKLNIFSEIGDLKSDDSIVLTIFRYSHLSGYEKVFSNVYFINDDSPLSARELEIIRLCQEGLSSKMIADRLQLSIHTVKNHKRNIMEKTMTHNITELIHVCNQNRWL